MGDSPSAGVIWLLFGGLAPALFVVKLPLALVLIRRSFRVVLGHVCCVVLVESVLPLASLVITGLLVDKPIMAGAPSLLESRPLRIGAFLAVLCALNVLANYFVLFGDLGEEAETDGARDFDLAVLFGIFTTAAFLMAWTVLGFLLER